MCFCSRLGTSDYGGTSALLPGFGDAFTLLGLHGALGCLLQLLGSPSPSGDPRHPTCGDPFEDPR